MLPATLFKRSSSLADSTLKQKMPASNALRISASVLPTPENTTLEASPPAAMTRANSPPETISKPAPNFANKLKIAKLGFDFTAKQTRWSVPSNPASKRLNAEVSASLEYT